MSKRPYPVTLTFGTDRTVSDVQQRAVEARLWRTCLNCEHRTLDADGDLTCAKFNAPPPLHVVVVGCEAWNDDIPF